MVRGPLKPLPVFGLKKFKIHIQKIIHFHAIIYGMVVIDQ